MALTQSSKIFAQADFPMTFFLVQDSTMTKMLIEKLGGRIIQSYKSAQHIILHRDDSVNQITTPTNDQERLILNNMFKWQLALSSNWISECCKQDKLVEEEQYLIRQPINPLSSISTPVTPISHQQHCMFTPQSSPALTRPTPSALAPHLQVIDHGHGSGSSHISADSATPSTEEIQASVSDEQGLSVKREREDDSHVIEPAVKRSTTGKEMIFYRTLKVWIQDPILYSSIRHLDEPERTYRKKDLFNILVVELAKWSNTQDTIYKGDVRRFCMTDLKKRRPWRDWAANWQNQRGEIVRKLNKLGIDTLTWNMKKGQSRFEIIDVSSDDEDDEQLEQSPETDRTDGQIGPSTSAIAINDEEVSTNDLSATDQNEFTVPVEKELSDIEFGGSSQASPLLEEHVKSEII